MTPTLQPGDRLLVLRTQRVRPGDLVVVGDPRAPTTALVKRLTAVDDDGGLIVRGDHPAASTDSAVFGPIAPHLLVGRVLWRYGPPGRAGGAGLRRSGAPQPRPPPR